MLTETIRTFPGNFQDQDRKKHYETLDRKSARKTAVRIKMKGERPRKNPNQNELRIAGKVYKKCERRKGGMIEEQDQITMKHSSWKRTFL